MDPSNLALIWSAFGLFLIALAVFFYLLTKGK